MTTRPNATSWIGDCPPSAVERIRRRIAVAARLVEDGSIATPTLLMDRRHLRANVARWQKHLPGVQPHYAVKANIDPLVLRDLFAAGAKADVASAYEIDFARTLGLTGDSLILSNPRKDRDTVLAMKAARVWGTMIDSEEEIDKLTGDGIPGAGYDPMLFVRIKVPTKGVQTDLGSKFGVRVVPADTDPFSPAMPPLVLAELRKLLRYAQKAGFQAFGLAFHVGTQCTDPRVYQSALAIARRTADALRQESFAVSTIDMGGGFPDGRLIAPHAAALAALPGADPADTPHDHLLAAAGRAAAECMRAGYRVVAEPGRYFVADAGFLVTRVTYDRSTGITGRRIQIDDGIYRTLSARVHDERDYQFHAFRIGAGHPPFLGMFSECGVWGCSCDSFDKVTDGVRLPADLQIGDYLLLDCLGAYSASFGSNTNGFQPAAVVAYEQSGNAIVTELSPLADVNSLLLGRLREWIAEGKSSATS